MTKPNILIIHADQHRFDCLGSCGNTDIKTPRLDALADDGVRFENSFCAFPVCTPSRYSMLCGLHVHQHTASSNHCTLPATIDTFPRLLKQAGYHTQAIGKMHFSPTYLDVGFEEMVLAEQHGPGRYDDDYHRYLLSKGLSDSIDLMDQEQEYRSRAPRAFLDSFATWSSDLPDEDYSTAWIGDRALEALENWESGGNLLMVGFIKPHHPFDAPASWARHYSPDSLSLLPGWTDSCLPEDLAVSPGYYPHQQLTEPVLRRIMVQYYASITQIDHYAGLMLETLKRKGLYDNTLVIFTSDHGEYMGFHHLILKASVMYDPLVKVPLIMKLPGSARRGEVVPSLVSNIDIAPTILEIAGCSPGDWMRGRSLANDKEGHELIFASAGSEYMARSRTHKLIIREDGGSRFYDLENDPLEMHNLFSDPAYQDDIKELKDRLLRWVLFEAPPPAGVDPCARVIKKKSDADKKKAIEHFRTHTNACIAEWGLKSKSEHAIK